MTQICSLMVIHTTNQGVDPTPCTNAAHLQTFCLLSVLSLSPPRLAQTSYRLNLFANL